MYVDLAEDDKLPHMYRQDGEPARAKLPAKMIRPYSMTYSGHGIPSNYFSRSLAFRQRSLMLARRAVSSNRRHIGGSILTLLCR